MLRVYSTKKHTQEAVRRAIFDSPYSPDYVKRIPTILEACMRG
jgi:hypothetical protein